MRLFHCIVHEVLDNVVVPVIVEMCFRECVVASDWINVDCLREEEDIVLKKSV